MGDQDSCVGVIETETLSAAVEAADAMLKSRKVSLFDPAFVGSKHFVVIILGETSPVRAAIETGAVAVQRKGTVLAKNVVPRCDRKLVSHLSQKKGVGMGIGGANSSNPAEQST